MIKPGPVYLRLCTDELRIVSLDWWERFLSSQERATAPLKIKLDSNQVSTSINGQRGSSTTNGESLESISEGRNTSGGRQEPVEVRSGLAS